MREDSAVLAAALGEHARARSASTRTSRSATTPSARAVLLRLLLERAAAAAGASPRPSPSTASCRDLALFRLLARARRVYGRESLGPFIISMTRGAGRHARPCCCWPAGPAARPTACDIVPLFETLDDLERAPRIADASCFALPCTARTCAACGGEQR